MKNPISLPVWIICLAFIWATFSAPSPALAEKTINVAVSIPPQKYFVEKIGGDRVRVSVMVLPGANPATYEPKPLQMVNLAKTGLYFAVGVPFEANWLWKFSEINPEMKIVKTQAGIRKIPMKAGRHRRHQTKHGSETTSTNIKDPHIWLSPPLVMVQAGTIRDALMKADPEGENIYKTNYQKFIGELKNLDLKITKVFEKKEKRIGFMVYHPSWGYFARTYGLQQIPIELEGKEPSPGKLLELIKEARKDGIKVIFVQPQFSEKSAETIANAIGGKIVFADPLSEDWKNNLIGVAEKFKSAFENNP